jgi:hypothetical protein
MDFNQFRTNRVDRVEMFKYEQSPPPHHVSANIVIIDKAHDGLFPLAYQFQHDIDYTDYTLTHSNLASLHIGDDAFIMLGDVDIINKNDRRILLRDSGTIRYKHLIVISHKNKTDQNSFSKHDEFVSALTTLIDALRTKKSLTREIPSSSVGSSGEQKKAREVKGAAEAVSSSSGEVYEIFYSNIANDPYGKLAVYHSPLGKRLYELQI